MKSIKLFFLVCIFAAGVSGTAAASDILIAYFSRTGNTKELALMIQRQTGGDLFEIKPSQAYPENYSQTVERYRRERAENIHPPLNAKVSGIDGYSTVFIGYPNWGNDIPPVIRTFLEEHNLSGKTVIPFCTNGGGGFGHSIRSIEQLCPDSRITDGFECSGRRVKDSESRLAQWLSGLGM